MTPIMKRTEKDDAVSPVVGVMLMLVVTIIIAAVVAAFASGVAGGTEKAPTVVLDVKLKTANVNAYGGGVFAPDFTIDHISGEALPLSDIAVTFSWVNKTSKKADTHTYYPAKDYGVNFTAENGLDFYPYHNSSMYINANPSVGSLDGAVLSAGQHLQTAGNYCYAAMETAEGTIMTGNPFLDFILTGSIISTYDSTKMCWNDGVYEYLGDSIHVSISHIPSNKVIFDKEVIIG